VGTFLGILFSYSLFGPWRAKIKSVRETRLRPYIVVKQTLLAFMNGADSANRPGTWPQDHLRYDRPTIDEVENETMSARPVAQKRSGRCSQGAA
jgi:chemotaxis protein MotA